MLFYIVAKKKMYTHLFPQYIKYKITKSNKTKKVIMINKINCNVKLFSSDSKRHTKKMFLIQTKMRQKK